ncbi:MAG: polysaccharide biosynthesis tyrosine autokinase [Thiogranum sp.]
MKIKNLMDFLNKEPDDSRREYQAQPDGDGDAAAPEEKVVYIENARLETAREQSENRELLASGTQWADQSMGDILVELGKLASGDVDRIIQYQREKGLYFGEAAVELKLVSQDDVLQALSRQFGYTYDQNEEALSQELVMAYSPFDGQAEEFRAIRSRLLNNWLRPEQKTLAIVSPDRNEGRSYVAANLALAFSQLGRPTLLIDADMRAPRQHENFNFSRRIGLSMLLAGRVRMEDLDMLPDQISSFEYLSVLGCGAVPPNPTELLSKSSFALILRELRKYFDVIIIDTPAATYQADVLAIASLAGSALMVARGGRTRIEESKNLMAVLKQADVNVVGAVLNQF